MKGKEAVAASCTIYRIADMTDSGRKDICDWLRKLARDISKEPKAFGKKFRARYMYPVNKGGRE